MTRLIIFIVLAISSAVCSQDFSGKATYQTKMIFGDFDMKPEGKESVMNDELMEQVKEVMKKSSEKTYFLEFTKNESFYREEEKLQQPTTGANHISVSFSSGASGNLYKNLKENYSLLENEQLGKTFIIKDTLHNSGWELSPESKQIGSYTVYKATKAIKATIPDFIEDEGSESDLLSMIKREPKDLIYTAWYTPEIPIANGPENFGGLPGLILELHTPSMVYLCSEIVLNPKKPIKIKTPKGKIISQREYDQMMTEQLKNATKTQKTSGGTIIQTITIGG